MRKYRICETEDSIERTNINSVDLENRKIYLFDILDEKTGMMISQSFAFWRQEDCLQMDHPSVEFTINCSGGYMEIALGVIAELSNPDNTFEVYANIISCAYSAAAIMLLYFKKENIKMFSGGQMMFHYSSWATPELNVAQHLRDSRTQSRVFDSIMSKGLDSTTLTMDKLVLLMNEGDVFYTADKCLHYNIVGEVYG